MIDYCPLTSAPFVFLRTQADGAGDTCCKLASSRIEPSGLSHSIELWEEKDPAESASALHLPSLEDRSAWVHYCLSFSY